MTEYKQHDIEARRRARKEARGAAPRKSRSLSPVKDAIDAIKKMSPRIKHRKDPRNASSARFELDDEEVLERVCKELLTADGWELAFVTSGVESSAGGDDGEGIFITRFVFKR